MPKRPKGSLGPRTLRETQSAMRARMQRVFKKIKKHCVKASDWRKRLGNKQCKRAWREYEKIEPLHRKFPFQYAERLRGDDRAEREWLEAWAAMKK